MKPSIISGSLSLAFAITSFIGFPAQAAEPAKDDKTEKPLIPEAIPIVPTRFLNPDDIPDPPEPKHEISRPGNEPALKNVLNPAVINRLYQQSDSAFKSKDYEEAARLIQELLEMLKSSRNLAEAREHLFYQLGITRLLAGQLPEAENTFKDYIKRYPNGEFISQANMGLGRSCFLQKKPEKKAEAIAALNLAAKNPQCEDEAEKMIKELSEGIHTSPGN